jgi:ABC-2 type transport system permease protein
VASVAPGLPRSAGRVTFAGALRSEFTKIRSVRSTYWTLLAMFVVVVGFGALASAGAAHGGPHGLFFDPTRQSLAGLYIGQLIIGILGVLVISSEYSTDMIRATLTANPHRGVMIAAKGVVFTVVALVTSLVTTFAAFFLGQAPMSSDHISTTIGSPNVLHAVIGGALFLTACGVLAFGLGLPSRARSPAPGPTRAASRCRGTCRCPLRCSSSRCTRRSPAAPTSRSSSRGSAWP